MLAEEYFNIKEVKGQNSSTLTVDAQIFLPIWADYDSAIEAS